MADQFDFTVKANPMQGVSLADLVAARTPAMTSVLQSVGPTLQALQARRQREQQLASLQAMQPGGQMTPEQILNLPPQATQFANMRETQAKTQAIEEGKKRVPLDPLTSAALSQKLQVPMPDKGFYYIDEIPALKAMTPNAGFGVLNLSQTQKDAIQYGIETAQVDPNAVPVRGQMPGILADGLSQQPGFKVWQQKKNATGDSATSTSFNPAQAHAGAQAKVAAAKLNAAGQPQLQARAAKGVMALTDFVQQASDAYNRTGVRGLNTIIGSVGKQFGYTGAQSFQQFANDTKLLLSTLMSNGGVPHDVATKMVDENIPDNATPAQVRAGLKNINKIAKARGFAVMTPVSASDFSDQSTTTPSQQGWSIQRVQ